MNKGKRRQVHAAFDFDMLTDLAQRGELSFDSIGRVHGLPEWTYRMYRRNKQ
jgi:hypothetical protein